MVGKKTDGGKVWVGRSSKREKEEISPVKSKNGGVWRSFGGETFFLGRNRVDGKPFLCCRGATNRGSAHREKRGGQPLGERFCQFPKKKHQRTTIGGGQGPIPRTLDEAQFHTR